MVEQRRKKKKNAKNHIFWKFYTTLVVLAVIIIGGDIAWGFFVKPPEVAPPPIIMNPDKDSSQDSSTSENPTNPDVSALVRKENFYNILLVGSDDGHGNADVMMVLGYDIAEGKAGLVSIPRDTIVDRTWSKLPKLNAALGRGGVDLIREEISATLGIPIDFYVSVDLSAFIDIVDAIGGLDFYVPRDMYHDDTAGFIIDLKEGQQRLTGRKTLELVRFRGYTNNDIGRTEMQQQVLQELTKQLLSWNSITKVTSFIEIFNDNVKTDMSLTNMLYFAQSALSIDLVNDINSHTLAGRGDTIKNGYDWCYELDADDTVEAVNAYLNPYTTPIKQEDMKILKADSIRVFD